MELKIAKGGLELTFCLPSFEEGYYRGTRFDHSGIFRKIVKNGFTLADEWFDKYDPYMHDAVCGASEEFTQSGYEQAAVGEVFLKPGVGLLLKEDAAPYDRFRLYKVADAGKWSITSDEESVNFIHTLESAGWGYVYEKTVRLLDGNRFEIIHRLRNTGAYAIEGQTYNHNFFTFGECRPGPEIEIDFTFAPSGNWRAEYDSVALSERGIRYSRPLQKGESVFMGDLKANDGAEVTGEVFGMAAAGHTVKYSADRPFDHIVFWSNHRVGCIEPFIPYNVGPSEEFEWTYGYAISASPQVL